MVNFPNLIPYVKLGLEKSGLYGSHALLRRFEMAEITLDEIIGTLRQRMWDAHGVVCHTRSSVQSAEFQGREHGYGHALQLLEQYKVQEDSKKT